MAAIVNLSQLLPPPPPPPSSSSSSSMFQHHHHHPHHLSMNDATAAFDSLPFEISDYLLPGDGQWEAEEAGPVAVDKTKLSSETETRTTSNDDELSTGARESGSKQRKNEEDGRRVGFRTKSVVEILDDGYKWRKYGKKSVKNSPNPRNYYKCNTQGCGVKKRVERDREDSSYVLTVYEGKHNHACPANSSSSSSSPFHSTCNLIYSSVSSSSNNNIYPSSWQSNALYRRHQL